MYRNKTRPFDGGDAGAAGGASSFGDSCSLRSVTSGASPVSPSSTFSSPSLGSTDGATLRTPPALAWNVFRDEKLAFVDEADAEGAGAGVGYE